MLRVLCMKKNENGKMELVRPASSKILEFLIYRSLKSNTHHGLTPHNPFAAIIFFKGGGGVTCMGTK